MLELTAEMSLHPIISFIIATNRYSVNIVALLLAFLSSLIVLFTTPFLLHTFQIMLGNVTEFNSNNNRCMLCRLNESCLPLF